MKKRLLLLILCLLIPAIALALMPPDLFSIYSRSKVSERPYGDLVTDGVFEAITLGSELHTDDNAAADSGGEVNATTGWIEFGLAGTGANVFESQGAVKNVGSYALHSDADATPTGGARFFKDIGTDFSLTIGKTYRLTFDWRHIGGAGDIWSARFASSTTLGADVSEVDTVDNSDVTFNSLSYDFTYTANCRYFGFREASATNDDGGVYVDNLSVKPVTFTSWTDTADGLSPGTSGGALTNKAAWDGSQSAASTLTQSSILWPGGYHTFVYTITRSAGTFKAQCGSTDGTSRNSAATYTEQILCNGADLNFEVDADFIGTLDTASVSRF